MKNALCAERKLKTKIIMSFRTAGLFATTAMKTTCMNVMIAVKGIRKTIWNIGAMITASARTVSNNISRILIRRRMRKKHVRVINP